MRVSTVVAGSCSSSNNSQSSDCLTEFLKCLTNCAAWDFKLLHALWLAGLMGLPECRT